MMGEDLPSNDDLTLKIMTNREVLAVNSTHEERELFRAEQIGGGGVPAQCKYWRLEPRRSDESR